MSDAIFTNNVEPIYVQEMDSPIGMLTLASSTIGLCAVEFGGVADISTRLSAWAQRTYGRAVLQRHPERLQGAMRQLEQYFRGERKSFDLVLDMQGTPFQLEVWRALIDIPYGEARSYKQIAAAIGRPQAVRAVGGANNRNPLPLIAPCHRVIGSDGRLVGYGGGMGKKITLLELEGIQVNVERL